ncbi:MAG: family 20 glycosylhydrolase [Bacteroidales bacterium]|jgi:hexosaminidase|nr:family 20 glycosylhydrolase [Bacteroidales bacterium]NLM91751.1 family 20 glycosylhydrolase [Bacteroidales bacterium]
MKKPLKNALPFLLLSLIVMTFCQRNLFPGENDFALEWELISNQYSEAPAVKARFTIANNGQFTLTGENWALYYNQSPRGVIGTEEASGVRLEHINGDWYRIIPLEGFSLKPGEQVEIIYECEAWWIKESDAPSGLYFVFNGKEGEEIIVEVKQYTILPFQRPEQIIRHNGDRTPMPTPELVFEENSKASLVSEEDLLPIIPSPLSVQRSGKQIVFKDPLTISYEVGLEEEANWLANMLENISGKSIRIIEPASSTQASIVLSLNDFEIQGKSMEGYRLEVKEDQIIRIEGNDRAGVFYGMQSLVALLPIEVILKETEGISLPVIHIEDAPRFGYRGLHIDVARNFQKKESILKVLDLMAFYKMNRLHFHLTEDEGWRLEIPALPELTEVGSKRGHTTMDASALHPAYGSGPFANAAGSWGNGYYSRGDYLEILKYASQRHIQIIPEINMPGHSRAAIKAMEARYEKFMAAGDEVAANEFRLIDPEETSEYYTAQSFRDNVVNVARESAYHFLETVLDEIIAMYEEAGAPLEIVNIGGDEVPGGAWTQSPMVDALIKEKGLTGAHDNMQAYFSKRALEVFKERNLKMAGWEEMAMIRDEHGKHVVNPALAGGHVIPNAWNSLWGMQDLAYRFANAGYPVILSHVTNFYFDLAYNKDPKEPGLYWGGFVKTHDAWHFSPFNVFITNLRDNMGNPVDPEIAYANMERLRPEARSNILGIQAQLWAETIFGPEMMEYSLLPKLIGLSETVWGAERIWENNPDPLTRVEQVEAGWNVFANTLARRELPRLSRLYGGFNYRIPLPGAIIQDGKLHANVEFPGLVIRYTFDGQEPSFESEEYTGPVEVNAPLVKLRAFDRSGRGSRVVEIKSEE